MPRRQPGSFPLELPDALKELASISNVFSASQLANAPMEVGLSGIRSHTAPSYDTRQSFADRDTTPPTQIKSANLWFSYDRSGKTTILSGATLFFNNGYRTCITEFVVDPDLGNTYNLDIVADTGDTTSIGVPLLNELLDEADALSYLHANGICMPSYGQLEDSTDITHLSRAARLRMFTTRATVPLDEAQQITVQNMISSTNPRIWPRTPPKPSGNRLWRKDPSVLANSNKRTEMGTGWLQDLSIVVIDPEAKIVPTTTEVVLRTNERGQAPGFYALYGYDSSSTPHPRVITTDLDTVRAVTDALHSAVFANFNGFDDLLS